MQDYQATMFLQSLRGNQALIVLAFLSIRAAMTIEDLEQVTGLHNDTVRAAVKGLATKQLLFMQRGEHGRQSWIPAGGTFFAQLFGQNPKISDSAGVVVNVELEERNLLQSTTTTLNGQSPKISDSAEREDQAACLAALDDAGIRGKKARDLLKYPWITVDYVRGHDAMIANEIWDNPQGMMIYRMEGQEPFVLKNKNSHKENCSCLQCKVERLRNSRHSSDDEQQEEI